MPVICRGDCWQTIVFKSIFGTTMQNLSKFNTFQMVYSESPTLKSKLHILHILTSKPLQKLLLILRGICVSSFFIQFY